MEIGHDLSGKFSLSMISDQARRGGTAAGPPNTSLAVQTRTHRHWDDRSRPEVGRTFEAIPSAECEQRMGLRL